MRESKTQLTQCNLLAISLTNINLPFFYQNTKLLSGDYITPPPPEIKFKNIPHKTPILKNREKIQLHIYDIISILSNFLQLFLNFPYTISQNPAHKNFNKESPAPIQIKNPHFAYLPLSQKSAKSFYKKQENSMGGGVNTKTLPHKAKYLKISTS